MQQSTQIVFAFGLILVAAAMNGAFALPMKIMRRWNWENSWLVWTVLSLWVLPPIAGLAAVPRLWEVYRSVSLHTFVTMWFCGILWGIGLVMIGLSYPLVGVAVAFAVSLGSAAAIGSLLPLLGQHWQSLFTPAGKLVLVGVVVMLVGVIVCGWAGRERERYQHAGPAMQGKSLRGFLLALIGGTLTAALNIALSQGGPILDAVYTRAGRNIWATNSVWVPVLFAGGIPGVAYCAWLIRQNTSLGHYAQARSAHYWFLGLLMSTLWFGSVLLYGVGVAKIGALGPVIGWPVFMSGAVLASSGWGALAGEWRNSGGRSRLIMAGGILLLILAVAIFAKAGS